MGIHGLANMILLGAVIRETAGMETALREIGEMEKELSGLRPARFRDWQELRSLLFTAGSITRAALARKESLGAHCRTDE